VNPNANSLASAAAPDVRCSSQLQRETVHVGTNFSERKKVTTKLCTCSPCGGGQSTLLAIFPIRVLQQR